MANKLKKGVEVVVISGDHKGKKGKILQVQRAKDRVLIEGVNLVKKHERKTQENPQGSICLLYTSPSPRDLSTSRMPSSA